MSLTRSLLCFSSLLILSGVHSTALASTNAGAYVVVHGQPLVQKNMNICPGGSASEDPVSQGLPCDQYDFNQFALHTSFHVYVVVANADPVDGVAGVQFGLDIDPTIGVFGWESCADLSNESPNWPQTGSAITLSWDGNTNCQQTVLGNFQAHAVAGAIYVYAYDSGVLQITADETGQIPQLTVTDCQGEVVTSLVQQRGAIGFGNELGFNPCTITPHCSCPGGTIGGFTCCCLPDLTTEVCLTREECESQGGSFSGHSCDFLSVGCETLTGCADVPTLPSSWGKLKKRHDN